MKILLQFDDLDVELVHKKIKNVYLRVIRPHGAVKISAPMGMRMDDLRLFVSSRRRWIKRQQIKIKQQGCEDIKQFIDGERHAFNGESYCLRVIEHAAVPRIRLEDNTLSLYIRPDTLLEKRQFIFNEWYRRHLKDVIPVMIKKYEEHMGVKVHEFGVKRMKTRWGTCNTKAQRIWLNLELAKRSPECLEYVVVHEMVHLLEASHNKRFITLMDTFMPQWKVYKAALNETS